MKGQLFHGKFTTYTVLFCLINELVNELIKLPKYITYTFSLNLGRHCLNEPSTKEFVVICYIECPHILFLVDCNYQSANVTNAIFLCEMDDEFEWHPTCKSCFYL